MNIFVCHTPFHYYVYKSIYENMPNAYFIIPPMQDRPFSPEWGGGMSADAIYDYIWNFLSGKKARILEYERSNLKMFFETLKNNAKNLIMLYGLFGLYKMDELDGIRLFQIPYTLGLDGIALKNQDKDEKYSRFRVYFFSDMIFTYGTHQANQLIKYGLTAKPVGNPIFDDWFNNKLNITEINTVEKRLDKTKKTILYLPTWNISSSIDKYFEAIKRLTSEYNVIIKLHHMTFTGEMNRLCKLHSIENIIVYGDYMSPLPLYKLADLIITDGVSGALFDSLIIKKPVIAIGTSLNEYNIDNIQQDHMNIPCVNDPDELDKAIEQTISGNAQLSEDALDHIFYYRDGNAGKRVADNIMNSDATAMSSLEKYDRGIKYAPDKETQQYIERFRMWYLKRNDKKSDLRNNMNRNGNIFIIKIYHQSKGLKILWRRIIYPAYKAAGYFFGSFGKICLGKKRREIL